MTNNQQQQTNKQTCKGQGTTGDEKLDELMPSMMSDEDDKRAEETKQIKRKKKKPLQSQYKDVPELQEIEEISEIPLAQDLMDPVTLSNIDLETEETTGQNTIEWTLADEALNMSYEKIELEQTKHVNMHMISGLITEQCSRYGVTTDPRSGYMLALALEHYIKNMLQDIAKWTEYRTHVSTYHPLFSSIALTLTLHFCTITNRPQLRINKINEEYRAREEKESKDESEEALMNERALLEEQRVTGFLTPEQELRRAQLDQMLKQMKTDSEKIQASQSSMARNKHSQMESASLDALGGDFVFDFSKKRKANQKANESGHEKMSLDKLDGSSRTDKDNRQEIQMNDVLAFIYSNRKYMQDLHHHFAKLYLTR
ncbi:hypothetical protein RFI_12336 [Reticulomyxa filosa]|uniref:Uncharacterized protein n=1 Tax=Reticulomyxa filosa TaxID=46433 RepID=X6NER4_RETFI|nr:hypothetical protein RFI_12336 [Reticulomyxa filosa]|eukprot:ETO24820.1 hypothetical protein RFI_12336 [Reticulomyxa filosa]